MKVDRSRFLHLVAAIAGATAACGAKQEPQAAVVVPVDAPPDASAPDAVAPVETAAPVATSGGIWTLPYDASKPPHTCMDLRCAGPTQEGMGALRNACKTIGSRLATEPFQRFMTCMMSMNNTRATCDLLKVGDAPGDCLHGWAETPNVDPATEAKCKPIVTACDAPKRSVHARKSIAMEDCQKILSVTNPKSETKMIHCVTEYCGEALHLCHGGHG